MPRPYGAVPGGVPDAGPEFSDIERRSQHLYRRGTHLRTCQRPGHGSQFHATQLNYGIYSPYVASVLDIARILDSFRTAQYQYIPALATQQDNRLALSLNAPPSFINPKSVLVVALPAIEQSQMPPLHAVDVAQIYCSARTPLVIARWMARRWRFPPTTPTT